MTTHATTTPDTARAVPDRLANLRDVAHTLRAIRSGVLLRSDAPLAGDVPAADVAWPPRTVVDLRDAGEATQEHPLADGATVHQLPVLHGQATLPAGTPRTLAELYLAMLDGSSATHLVQAVRHIATGATPVLVHCTAGKDRTGVTVALALTLAGAPRSAVVHDYTLTTTAMAGVLARMPASANIPLVAADLANLPRELLAAPAEAIETFLDALAAHEGGALGWFLAHGGDERTVVALRERLHG